MGMTAAQVIWRVELPLAVPVIIAGMRIATLSIISLTTIAAWIGAGGLGQVLRDGIANDDSALLLAGIGAVTLLALFADGVYRLIEWLNTPYLRPARARRATPAGEDAAG